MAIPSFDVWSECYICGEDHPESEMVRHVRLGKLVDKDCADQLGFADIKALMDLPYEERRQSEQPVRDQGDVSSGSGGGAGGGGAGGGGAG